MVTLKSPKGTIETMTAEDAAYWVRHGGYMIVSTEEAEPLTHAAKKALKKAKDEAAEAAKAAGSNEDQAPAKE